ncbi:MAG: class I SAM-dependent methyltransferase, partial [Myxococcota bacterium]
MFDTIERMQADVPWGRVLDAGTGVRSLRWLRGLDTTGITAVTASGRLAAELRDGVDLRPPDAVVVGNWADPRLLHEERFDTVIADYVVGAIEIHAPYFQARFLERLRTHVTGRLYLTGIAPHGRSVEPGAARIAAILDLRDVAFVLLGARPYREYPLHWVRHALHRAGFRVDQTEVTQVRADEGWVRHQVDGCR